MAWAAGTHLLEWPCTEDPKLAEVLIEELRDWEGTGESKLPEEYTDPD